MAGDLAALVCALCFALCSMAFAAAGRVVGASIVNQVRILLAAVVLFGAHLVIVGDVWPLDLSGDQQMLLIVSGVIGLTLGDLCYFHALTVVGPRLGTLLMATFPLFTVLGDGVLRQVWPAPSAGLYMLCIVAGVAVVLARRPDPAGQASGTTPGRFAWAVVAGLLGAVGQGLGLVVSKMADTVAGGVEMHSLSMTLVRMVAGLAGAIALAGVGFARTRRTARQPMTGAALGMIVVGALLGPIAGVWLSMFAVQETSDTGRAAVLIALTPVLMIPISRLAYGDRPGGLGWVGTLVAFAGTVGLMIGRG